MEISNKKPQGYADAETKVLGEPPTPKAEHLQDVESPETFQQDMQASPPNSDAAIQAETQHLPPDRYVPGEENMQESRPREYVPPSHYVPTDDDDDEIRQLLAQRAQPGDVQNLGHLDATSIETSKQSISPIADATQPRFESLAESKDDNTQQGASIPIAESRSMQIPPED